MAHECCCGDTRNKRDLPIDTTGSIVPALGLALKFFSPLPEGLSSSDTGCTPQTDQQHTFTVSCYKKIGQWTEVQVLCQAVYVKHLLAHAQKCP